MSLEPESNPVRVCTVGSRTPINGSKQGPCVACFGPTYYQLDELRGDLICDVCWLQKAADLNPADLQMHHGDVAGFAKELGVSEDEAADIARDLLEKIRKDPLAALEAIKKPPPTPEQMQDLIKRALPRSVDRENLRPPVAAADTPRMPPERLLGLAFGLLERLIRNYYPGSPERLEFETIRREFYR